MAHLVKQTSAVRRFGMGKLVDFVRFSRPHTIIATSLQVFTMWLLVGGPTYASGWSALALSWGACLGVNIFVVGINQVVDVPIDRINKPWLPLAADTMRSTTAMWISWSSAALSLLFAWLAGPYLLVTVGLILLIGAAYSLPPLRWKRFPILAALSIAFARGFLANVGVGLHFVAVFKRSLPPELLPAVGLFFFGFALVIALYKDLPDAPGDRAGNIETFTTRLGTKRVLLIGLGMLSVCYAALVIAALTQLPEPSAWWLLISHSLLPVWFWITALQVDLTAHIAVARFYRVLWLLFYSEFILLSGYAIARMML